MSNRTKKLFAAACGLTEPWKMTVFRSGQVISQHDFDRPFALIGRDERNSIRLQDPEVSECHSYVQVLPEGIVCVDLGSRTGVRVGNELRDHCWLGPDDRIGIGPYTLAAQPTVAADSVRTPRHNPLSKAAQGDSTLPLVAAHMSAAGIGIGRWRMNAVVALIGTSPRCKLRMHHESVSPFHCSLVRTRIGLWAIDLLSTRGTMLNGRPIVCEPVFDGDLLQIGDFVLRMRLHPSRNSQLLIRLEYHDNEPEPAAEPAPLAESASTAPAQNLPAVVEAIAPDGSLVASFMQQFGRVQQQMFEQFHHDMNMMARLFLSMHREQMATVGRELDELRAITEDIQALQEELRSQLANPSKAARLAHTAEVAAADFLPPAPSEKKKTLPPRAGTSQPSEDIHVWLNRRIADLTAEHQTRWQKLLSMITGN